MTRSRGRTADPAPGPRRRPGRSDQESITRLLPIGGRCLVVGSAGGTDEAVALAATLVPDVAVIDSRLHDDEGVEGVE